MSNSHHHHPTSTYEVEKLSECTLFLWRPCYEFLLNGVEIYNLDSTELSADLTMNTRVLLVIVA